ncbi:MAG: hypothetical protein ABIJ48_04055 [Actinomycetota bacterium]
MGDGAPLPTAGRWASRRRLATLRRRIARGEYRIPAEAVADAVLRAWARPGPGDAGPGSG